MLGCREGKDTSMFHLSRTVKMNNFWSGDRDVQSLGTHQFPSKWQAFGLAPGAAGFTQFFTLILWTEAFADRAVPDW